MPASVTYQVSWKPSTKEAFAAIKGAGIPAGATKIAEFTHEVDYDSIGAPHSHTLFHHVRDALYHQGQQNMQEVRINTAMALPMQMLVEAQALGMITNETSKRRNGEDENEKGKRVAKRDVEAKDEPDTDEEDAEDEYDPKKIVQQNIDASEIEPEVPRHGIRAPSDSPARNGEDNPEPGVEAAYEPKYPERPKPADEVSDEEKAKKPGLYRDPNQPFETTQRPYPPPQPDVQSEDWQKNRRSEDKADKPEEDPHKDPGQQQRQDQAKAENDRIKQEREQAKGERKNERQEQHQERKDERQAQRQPHPDNTLPKPETK